MPKAEARLAPVRVVRVQVEGLVEARVAPQPVRLDLARTLTGGHITHTVSGADRAAVAAPVKVSS